MAGGVAAALVGAILGARMLTSRQGDDLTRDVEAWRRARLARLTSDEGWLVLAGLFWLKDGPNRFGSAQDNDLVFPDHAPGQAGVLHLQDGQVTVAPAPGVSLTLAGAPPGQRPLRDDLAGTPDVLAMGDLRFFVIRRDGRLALRLRDLRSPRRRQFGGLSYFPIRHEYRVQARFVPHAEPRSMMIPNITGKANPMANPGAVHFELQGRAFSLEALTEDPADPRLFLIFRDRTAGKETYGAGRFLYTPAPRDGQVVLDFNKAYTPPCGFTPFATCPLPPPQNRLAVRIEAGEKYEGHHP